MQIAPARGKAIKTTRDHELWDNEGTGQNDRCPFVLEPHRVVSVTKRKVILKVERAARGPILGA